MARDKRPYAGDGPQSANLRHKSDRNTHLQQEEHFQPAYQDSWRSYKYDATNLQEMASRMGFTNYQNYDYDAYGHAYDGSHIQQPSQADFYHTQNQTASSFQAINSHPFRNNPYPAFTQYQPLRVSNGNWERNALHQVRHGSTFINSEGSRQYALRSHDPTMLTNQHMYNTQQQIRQHSSVPINIVPLPGLGSYTQTKPQNPTPPARPPPRPSPRAEYLSQASLPPTKLVMPQKLLVVMDLNGTLLSRSRSSGSSFVLRPGVSLLMEYLFANHVVMVYTSSRPVNAQGMVTKLFHPDQRKQLAAVWARDKLGLSREQYLSKVQTYKNLERIWADEDIQQQAGENRRWDQSNTVLIDDSHVKAAAQPYNLLKVAEFTNDRPNETIAHGKKKEKQKKKLEQLNAWNTLQQKTLEDLQEKLEELRWFKDVSQTIHAWQLAGTISTEQSTIENVEVDQSYPRSESDQSDDRGDTESQGRRLLGLDGSDDQANDGISHSDGSVSPIDESVWRDILGGIEEKRDDSQKSRDTDG